MQSSSAWPLTPPPSNSLGAIDDCGDGLMDLCLGAPMMEPEFPYFEAKKNPGAWVPGMTLQQRKERRDYLMQERGRSGLRILIVTENFLPKVDGVTRTLARLLEHLQREGHECMLLGPETGMTHYATHPLVGTLGVPLIIYPGLKLNFLRPRFLSKIHKFQPDVVHVVDPIWLGGQTMMAMERGWGGRAWEKKSARDKISDEEEMDGAVVASYHTNLGTYATLFGMPWLEPIIWKWQRHLYSKTLLTLCPSPSTASMLHTKSFSSVRLWPRGVELKQFGPGKRSLAMRRSWGIEDPVGKNKTVEWKQNNKAGEPMSPPLTPLTTAADAGGARVEGKERLVAMYVGRVSWEKNLLLLLRSLLLLPAHLPPNTLPPKIVFVGDGPARAELERICKEKNIDAVFMGHRSGEELAACYASADVFCFPSFTETFGQVVLEALASGLPVIGLDADGTRDLVTHEHTGLLLSLPRLPSSRSDWPQVCRHTESPLFADLADKYAKLIARCIKDGELRGRMSKGAVGGVEGWTWWDAMERCVDGYRESMRMSKANQAQRIAERAESGGQGLRVRPGLVARTVVEHRLAFVLVLLAWMWFMFYSRQ